MENKHLYRQKHYCWVPVVVKVELGSQRVEEQEEVANCLSLFFAVRTQNFYIVKLFNFCFKLKSLNLNLNDYIQNNNYAQMLTLCILITFKISIYRIVVWLN